MVTQEEILHRFLVEGGREEPRFLKGTPGYGLHVDNENQLCFLQGRRNSRGQRDDPLQGADRDGVVLARWAGSRYAAPGARGCLILNGDGFEDFRSTDWQTRLRDMVQNQRRPGWTNPEQTGGQAMRWALIPFMALDGARINKDSIRVIEQTNDRQEIRFQVRNITQKQLDDAITALHHDSRQARPHGGWSINGSTMQNSTRREFQGNLILGGREYMVSINEFKESARNQRWALNNGSIMWAPENAGRASWHAIMLVNSLWGHDNGVLSVDESGLPRSISREQPLAEWMTDETRYLAWQENVHRLGSSVFSAVGFDRGRHTFVSAFDQQEPQPLYFLAQLPDDADVKTYDEAIYALAPPLVHAARAQGKEVFRHGDVFAVEVPYDDKQLAKMDVQSWVARDIVMQANTFGTNPQWAERAVPPRTKVVKPEWYTFNDPCPHCAMLADVPTTDHTYPQVNGPSARRWLSIYRTGHTADFVVVLKDGRTFLKGRMFHDPHIEEPDRTRGDHQIIALGNSTKWFLAVRNTVPAQGDGASDSGTPVDSAVAADAAVDSSGEETGPVPGGTGDPARSEGSEGHEAELAAVGAVDS